jgi:hypothetical protein
MKRLPLITHSLFAELADQCRSEPRNPELWSLSGSIVTVPVDGQAHWYFQKSRRTTSGKYQQREYIGPVGDQGLASKVAAFEAAKAGYNGRMEIISTLKSSGVAAPTGKLANLLLGLHEAGVLERALIVGTIAFQAYGAMLGAKFGQSAFHTLDVDMTEARTISLAVKNNPAIPLLDVLTSLDETFREVPGMDPRTPPISYINQDKIRLDVLMPFCGPSRGPIHSKRLGSHGQPQRLLDYLVIDPVETILLVGGGAPTHVPSPARFALHKLIVSQRRHAVETAKKRKDLLQAQQLIELLTEDDPGALREAYKDLKSRGPKWNAYFKAGVESLDTKAKQGLADIGEDDG